MLKQVVHIVTTLLLSIKLTLTMFRSLTGDHVIL